MSVGSITILDDGKEWAYWRREEGHWIDQDGDWASEALQRALDVIAADIDRYRT